MSSDSGFEAGPDKANLDLRLFFFFLGGRFGGGGRNPVETLD